MSLNYNFAPPQGWGEERIPGTECTVFAAPHLAGSVTVDFDARSFRAGYSTTGKIVSHKPYAGRGWRDRLCADAVQWLDRTLQHNPALSQYSRQTQ